MQTASATTQQHPHRERPSPLGTPLSLLCWSQRASQQGQERTKTSSVETATKARTQAQQDPPPQAHRTEGPNPRARHSLLWTGPAKVHKPKQWSSRGGGRHLHCPGRGVEREGTESHHFLLLFPLPLGRLPHHLHLLGRKEVVRALPGRGCGMCVCVVAAPPERKEGRKEGPFPSCPPARPSTFCRRSSSSGLRSRSIEEMLSKLFLRPIPAAKGLAMIPGDSYKRKAAVVRHSVAGPAQEVASRHQAHSSPRGQPRPWGQTHHRQAPGENRRQHAGSGPLRHGSCPAGSDGSPPGYAAPPSAGHHGPPHQQS